MSYCRWSSDDFGCDLYCYEDVSGGWTTHVATRRVVGDVPKIVPMAEHNGPVKMSPWFKSYQAQMEFLKTAERAPIGLAYDGATFNDDDLEGFLATLLMLREAGYRFPDHVLEMVRDEIAAGGGADED